MKRLFLIILLFSFIDSYAKDFHKTEEMINSILNESNTESAVKNGELKKNDTANEEVPSSEQKDINKTEPDKNEQNDEKEIKNTALSGKDEILLKTGIQLFESRMYDHSLSRFNDIIKNHPSSRFIDSARMYTGKIYIRKYDYENAIKQFDAVNEKSGEYPASLFYKGEALRLKGEIVTAIETYQKVSSTFPENELADDSILITGKLYLKNRKGYQALESALKIVRYYKNSETIDDAYYLIARIYERDPILKDNEMSRKFYRSFLKKADSGQKHFADSPLKNIVKKDLDHLEKRYFRLEH